MKRFKPIYIVLPLVILILFTGVQSAHAEIIKDWGDVAGVVGIVGGGIVALAAGGWVIPVLGAVGAIASFVWSGLFGDAVLNPIAESLVRIVAGILISLIAFIGDILFKISIGMVGGALDLSNSLKDSLVVKEGFNIVLDIANIGLVIAIIVIAFMVMLRRDNATKLLPRFIAVALLINFSFLIVTNLIIEPVNQVTEVLRQATNFDKNSFGAIFKPEVDWGLVLLEDDNLTADDVVTIKERDFILGMVISFFSVIFVATFYLIGTISLFAFAIMLYIRYIALSILIILMPIAWIAWIFPNLKITGGNPSTIWWGAFMRWLFFAPIVMFFFFLAVRLVVIENLPGIVTQEASNFVRVLAATGNMFVVVGFMIGGLIVANKMSITGSSYALATIKKGGKYARGKASNRLRQEVAAGTEKIVNHPAVKKRLENLTSFGSEIGTGGGRFRKIVTSPLRGATGAVRAVGKGSMEAGQRSEGYLYNQEKERLKKYAPYRLGEMLEQENLPRFREMAMYEIMNRENDNLYETPIGRRLARMHKEKDISRHGHQRLGIDLYRRGLDPRIGYAIDLDQSDGAIDALERMRLDAMTDKDVTSKLEPKLIAPYNPASNDYGFTHGRNDEERAEAERIHDAHGEGRIRYHVYDRPDTIIAARRGMDTAGKRVIDRMARQRLQEDELVRGVLSAGDREEDQIRYAVNNWTEGERIREQLLGDRLADLDEVSDEILDGNARDGEISRIVRDLDNLGPEGFAKEAHALQNSQRSMLSALSDIAEGTEPAPTAATPNESAE